MSTDSDNEEIDIITPNRKTRTLKQPIQLDESVRQIEQELCENDLIETSFQPTSPIENGRLSNSDGDIVMENLASSTSSIVEQRQGHVPRVEITPPARQRATSPSPQSMVLDDVVEKKPPIIRSDPISRRSKPKRSVAKSVNEISEQLANELLASFTNRDPTTSSRNSGPPPLKDTNPLPPDLMSVELDEAAKNHPSFTEPTAISAVRIAKELNDESKSGTNAENADNDSGEMNKRIIRTAIRKITQPKVLSFRRFLSLVPIEVRFDTCNKKKTVEAAEADIPEVSLNHLRSQLRSPIYARGERKCINENNCIAVLQAHAREPLMQFQTLRVQSELARKKKEHGVLEPNMVDAIYKLNPYHLSLCVLCLEYDTLVLHSHKLGWHAAKGTLDRASVEIGSATTGSTTTTTSSTSGRDDTAMDNQFKEVYQTFQVITDIPGEYDSRYCLSLSQRPNGIYAAIPCFDCENYTFTMHDVDGVRCCGLVESDKLVYKPEYPPKTLTNFQ